MPRPPVGDRAMTAAERQRRHRGIVTQNHTPERQALAEAIARREAAHAELSRVREAYDRIELYGENGVIRAVEVAERQLRESRERAPHRLVDRLLGGVAVADEVEVAEQGLATAQRAKAEALIAQRQFEDEILPAAQRAVERAEGEVKAAATAVLFPLVEPAIAELERSERAVVAAGDRLKWLQNQGVVQIRRAAPGGTMLDDGSLEARAQRALFNLEMPPVRWDAIMRELHETTRRTGDWEAALHRLMTDAEAELPE